jgi:MerR family transcriptional regulator, aldehyde-responsive regulator
MTIKEVSELTGISIDNLRYYERIGLIPPVPRKENGIRDFDEMSLHWIDFAMKFKRAGMPLEAIIEYMRLARLGDSTREARKQILEEARDNIIRKINELQKTLDFANYKINDFYGDCSSEIDKLVKQKEDK